MPTIYIEKEEVKVIEEQLLEVASSIARVSSNNYISNSPFHTSSGQSVEQINACIACLIDCANHMQEVVIKTAQYVSKVVAEFQYIEDTYTKLFEGNTQKLK